MKAKVSIRFCIILLMLVGLALVAGYGKNTEVGNASTNEPTGNDQVEIKTEYVTLSYPTEFEGKLTHSEVVQDGVALEVFTGLVGGVEREVFRIYFNEANQGAVVGYIVRGSEEIPVSYSVCDYEEELTTDSMKKEYYDLMDVFEAIMNSVYADPQYTDERYEKPVGTQKIELEYWKFEIPENLSWEESHDDVRYRVNFYGMVKDARVELYAIGWGEMEADYSLGTVSVNGIEREVLVRIYDVPEQYGWDEADYNSLYRMLESVNTVTDTILASK